MTASSVSWAIITNHHQITTESPENTAHYHATMTGPASQGAWPLDHFTDDFSFVTHIPQWGNSIAIQSIAIILLQNCAHVTITVLSWHVHNFVTIVSLISLLGLKEIIMKFELPLKHAKLDVFLVKKIGNIFHWLCQITKSYRLSSIWELFIQSYLSSTQW